MKKQRTIQDLEGLYSALYATFLEHIKETEQLPYSTYGSLAPAMERLGELVKEHLPKHAATLMQACTDEECESVGFDTSTGRFSFEEDQTPRPMWQGEGYWANALKPYQRRKGEEE